jgi:hypothetical protein
MMRLLRATVSCVVVGMIWLSPPALAQSVITAYFVPFEIETYVPITPTTISDAAWEKWTISSKRKMSHLIDLLSRGSAGSFDEHRVRVMIVAGSRTYLIDASGIALVGKEAIQIDRSKLEVFRKSLSGGERKVLRSQSGNQSEESGRGRE